MKIKIMMILFVLFMCIGSVYGGNNTTDIPNPKMLEYNDFNTTIALESGDSNITFSNNMTGYCIEYREHSASANDVFYITNTSKTINKNDGSDVSNYLKTFFIKFHNQTVQNNLTYPVNQSVFNQHIIWYFTNNFTSPITTNSSWLIDTIIEESLREKLDDNGYYDYDNDTRAYYSFATLLASYEEYQNFFAYNIYFTDIPNNNITDDINNNTINETDNIINETNNTINENNDIETIDLDIKENTYVKNKHMGLEKYKTGNSIMVLLVILICLCILMIKNR